MKKIKLTKNELKKQKDNLKRFNRYLPTLYIKKQQLQMEVAKVRIALSNLKSEMDEELSQMDDWVGLLASDYDVSQLIQVEEVETKRENVAGSDIRAFLNIRFKEEKYDLLQAPLWVDAYREKAKILFTLEAKTRILREQERVLTKELLETSQRVNLFEKIKIPEAERFIKKIRIYLGDQQTASVGWARLAKQKLVAREG